MCPYLLYKAFVYLLLSLEIINRTLKINWWVNNRMAIEIKLLKFSTILNLYFMSFNLKIMLVVLGMWFLLNTIPEYYDNNTANFCTSITSIENTTCRTNYVPFLSRMSTLLQLFTAVKYEGFCSYICPWNDC